MEITEKAENLINKLKLEYVIDINLSTGPDYKYICTLWKNGTLVSSGKGKNILTAVKRAEKAIGNYSDKRTKSNDI